MATQELAIPPMYVNDDPKPVVAKEEPAKEEEAKEPEAKAETPDLESRLTALLVKEQQKEQMKRATFEKSQAQQLQSLKDELLVAIKAGGGQATAKQEAALDKIEAIEDGRDDLEGATFKDIKILRAQVDDQIEKKARKIADDRLAERDEAAAKNYEGVQDFLRNFDASGSPDGKEVSDAMKGKAAEVLEKYSSSISKFKSLGRLSADDRTAIEQAHYKTVYAEFEAKATAEARPATPPPPAKKPGKSPEGTQVVKQGASTTQSAISVGPSGNAIPENIWSPG